MPSETTKAAYAPPPFLGKSAAVNEDGFPYDWQSLRKIVAKVADFTANVNESGAFFALTPTGDIEVTLPPVADSAGVWFEFVQIADFELLITSPEGDNIVLLHTASADAISITTAGQHIGGSIRVISDGTLWYAHNISAGVVAVTVVDA